VNTSSERVTRYKMERFLGQSAKEFERKIRKEGSNSKDKGEKRINAERSRANSENKGVIGHSGGTLKGGSLSPYGVGVSCTNKGLGRWEKRPTGSASKGNFPGGSVKKRRGVRG